MEAIREVPMSEKQKEKLSVDALSGEAGLEVIDLLTKTPYQQLSGKVNEIAFNLEKKNAKLILQGKEFSELSCPFCFKKENLYNGLDDLDFNGFFDLYKGRLIFSKAKLTHKEMQKKTQDGILLRFERCEYCGHKNSLDFIDDMFEDKQVITKYKQLSLQFTE